MSVSAFAWIGKPAGNCKPKLDKLAAVAGLIKSVLAKTIGVPAAKLIFGLAASIALTFT